MPHLDSDSTDVDSALPRCSKAAPGVIEYPLELTSPILPTVSDEVGSAVADRATLALGVVGAGRVLLSPCRSWSSLCFDSWRDASAWA